MQTDMFTFAGQFNIEYLVNDEVFWLAFKVGTRFWLAV
jgi:hypothetical protein